MRLASLVFSLELILLSACAGLDDSPVELGEVHQAERATVCEDECPECGEVHRCGRSNETRYLCVMGGKAGEQVCAYPTPIACVCCDANEILVGDHWTGACQACPTNQKASDVTNECGCFASDGSFFTCAAHEKCHGDACCAPIARDVTCAGHCGETVSDGCGGSYACEPCACAPLDCAALGWECGVGSDGCGGALHCGSCGPNAQCTAAHQCACAPGYKLCGDVCSPSGRPCPRLQ